MPYRRAGATSAVGRRTRRRSLGQAVSAVWLSARWIVLAILATVAFVLGYVGFREYFNEAGVPKSTSDLVYLSLQLFTLESGSAPETGAPWQLEVARLAAPLTTVTALVAALAAAFQQQLHDWRLRRARGHVVVCGLGRRGTRLASELLEEGHRVVGVDVDGQNSSLGALRRRGASVVVGDSRDPDTLRRLRLAHASHLVCLTGTDDTNAEVVLQAAALVERRRGPSLTCLAHIRDPDLCVLMRSEELAAARKGGLRLDFFNIDEQGARVMLQDHSPFPPDGPSNAVPRVLVVGLNRLGQSLVAEVARQWRIHPAADGHPIQITMVDPMATDIVARLRRRYPQLDHAARLIPVVADLDPLELEAATVTEATVAYVCMDRDSSAVQAALRLRQALTDPDAVIVVELVQAVGMAGVISRPAHFEHIQAFDVLDRTMRADLLLGGTHEILARAIHEEYLEEQRRQGATAATNPSMVPWEQLPTSLKESNRDQAAHIGTKLAVIGRGIAPLTDWDADQKTTFTEQQVESLAEMEHDRWVEQRRRDGWTTGAKDIEAKKTPYLVSWDSLSEEVKEWDREAVRGIPAFLTRAGYQIVQPAT